MALNAYPLHAAESERNDKKAIVISKYVIGLSSMFVGLCGDVHIMPNCLTLKLESRLSLTSSLTSEVKSYVPSTFVLAANP